MNLHTDHRLLRRIIIGVFLFLSLGVAVVPAFQMQNETPPLAESHRLSDEEKAGLRVYVAEGCIGCHTQQVRSLPMDEVWGKRPSDPSDYYYSKKRLDVWRQAPSLLGSGRIGPDLTSIGERQPSDVWHLLHLYNPRIVAPQSMMPGYPWLFEEKEEAEEGDIVVPVPEEFLRRKGVTIVAGPKALYLTAYLIDLTQPDLESAIVAMHDAVSSGVTSSDMGPDTPGSVDGDMLYTQHCAACHQANGMGLPGAFPPLSGSEIVTSQQPDELITVIINGYDERDEYAIMPPFGAILSNEEIQAIANHERTNWGNAANPISIEDIERIRQSLAELETP